MKMDIFMPEKLKVGFQERCDTYTEKLAYIIYYDTKGVLRKEKSWESWRDQKIDPLEVENIPTSGFVLNKKAGGYSSGWNHRQTYVRVYDPRGFEFEISVPNLLYILENTNSIKGKGLEGEFVYGWNGTELILIPTSAPDYKELEEYNSMLQNKTQIKAKDLILGATYKTKKNETVVYLGRFEHYDSWDGKARGKKHFFRNISSTYIDYETLKTLGDKLISVVSEDCISNYAELMEQLESSNIYSPYDKSKDEYVPYELEEFVEDLKESSYFTCYTKGKEQIQIFKNQGSYKVRKTSQFKYIIEGTPEEIFEKLKPTYLKEYLVNGKLYRMKD